MINSTFFLLLVNLALTPLYAFVPKVGESVYARYWDDGINREYWYDAIVKKVHPNNQVTISFSPKKRPERVDLEKIISKELTNVKLKKGDKVITFARLARDGKQKIYKTAIVDRYNSQQNAYLVAFVEEAAGKKFVKREDLRIFRTANSEGAGACNRVNLLRYKWTKLRQLPQYDQRDTHMCYAFSGNQLFNHWKELNGLRITESLALGSNVYSALLARLYINDERRSSLNIGNLYNVIGGIKKYGMCQDVVIQESLHKFSKKHQIDPLSFIQVTSFLMDNMNQKFGDSRGWFWNARYRDDAKKKAVQLFDQSQYRDNKININKILDLMWPYIQSGNYVSFLKDVFQDCFKKENTYLISSKIPYPKWVAKGNDPKSFLDLKNSALQLLNRPKNKNTPLGITYCLNLLTKRNYVGLNDNNEKMNHCSPHVSLIVGKRVRNFYCEFLVRNTWGNYCDKYDWECLKDEKGNELGVWIDANMLMRNTLGIYYLP